MAIDSAEKRRSIAGILLPLIMGVTPTASPDAEWRQEAGWSYSGIAAAAIAAGALTTLLQHNSGSGWVDVAGTTRNVTGSPGDWPNLSFATVLDVGAGDQLRVVWVKNETNVFKIPADNSSMIVEYLKLQ